MLSSGQTVQIFDAMLERTDHLLEAVLVLHGNWVLVFRLQEIRDDVKLLPTFKSFF